jgi:hypothetical protein
VLWNVAPLHAGQELDISAELHIIPERQRRLGASFWALTVRFAASGDPHGGEEAPDLGGELLGLARQLRGRTEHLAQALSIDRPRFER